MIATIDQPETATAGAPDSGVCQFCGCTDDRACWPPCAWANVERTICDAQPCLDKAAVQGVRLG